MDLGTLRDALGVYRGLQVGEVDLPAMGRLATTLSRLNVYAGIDSIRGTVGQVDNTFRDLLGIFK